MTTRELKSERQRLTSQLLGLQKIADISEEAQLQIEYVKEELQWIEDELDEELNAVDAEDVYGVLGRVDSPSLDQRLYK